MSKKQFNVEIPTKDADRAKTDAIKLNVSVADYTAEALRYFRTIPVADLKKRFAGVRKTVGRKVCL